ncbi:MAG: ABC transporter permease [Candidatus Acidiferrum sp.]
MAIWTNLIKGIRGLFGKKQSEQELDDELRDFLEKAAAENMRAGMTREEAFRRARLELGGVEAVKESVRSASWETHIETLWSDLRFGARLLRFNKVFAGAAILSLALGIGANTAIFQLLDAVRMRTLPVKNPEQIARIAIDHRTGASGDFTSRYSDLTYPLWADIHEQQQGFSSAFAWSPTLFNIAPSGEVHMVQGLLVSGEFFQTLGIEPALGRFLTTADDTPGCASSGAVISYSFWQRQYGGDPTVLGRQLSVDRHPFEIAGVTRADFYGVEVGRAFDIIVPLCVEPLLMGQDSQMKSRSGWWLASMGRLKPGWTIERATAQLQAISPAIFEDALPADYNALSKEKFLRNKLGAFSATSGVSTLRKDNEQPLWLLLALAGLVLLIASANLANLMLARASAREKEMAMRMAVGAGRGRLIRQLLAESLLLAAIGATLGGLLARSLAQMLVASLSTQRDPLFVELGTDWRILGFTAGLAALTCVFFGLAPALRATNVSPSLVLKEGGRGTTDGRSRFGLRRLLVVSQIALSLMLLVGALLFARSLAKLTSVETGFRQTGILITDIDYTTLNLPAERRTILGQDLLRRVRGIAGVDDAAIAETVPLSGNEEFHDVLMGLAEPPKGQVPSSAFNHVSPGFFETLRTPILAGRDFNERDVADSPLVAIVNESFVRKFLKQGNPIGTTFRVRRLGTISGPYEVVGLVKDTKYGDLREQAQDLVYLPIFQDPRPDQDSQILIHSSLALPELIAGVKEVASGVSSSLDLTFQSFHTMIEDGLLNERLMAKLSGFFGVLAVVLAVVGLYGVVSYMVARRRNEIGIRMSLGADRKSIIGLVLGEALLLLAIGVVIGLGLALAGSSAANSLLFGLKGYDATTLIMATAILSVIALTASYLPALRASRLDPMDALRHE